LETDVDLMTMADVCLALKVSRRTVYRMVRQGVLPAPQRLGNFKQGYFKRADLDKFCANALR